jgi:argininosuccinate lyase
LGSAAGYGTTLPVDKAKIAAHLGFSGIFANPIQAITFKGDAESRFLFNITMFLNHLATLAETLILFSTKEFGFITINDAFSTGSSIMPQKKNPDILEVVKAKAAVCQGYLAGVLGITKGQFVGYNRDSQWIKYLVTDAVDEVKQTPTIMAKVIETLIFHGEVAAQTCGNGFILSQAVMEGLIAEFHLPMREAKIVTETAVKNARATGKLSAAGLNEALIICGYDVIVDSAKFIRWTDPQTVADLQLKDVYGNPGRLRRR